MPPRPDGVIAEDCAVHIVPRSQELLDNVPYAAMIVLGAAVLWVGLPEGAWRWIAAVSYALYGLVGAAWIICFVCPYCRFYDTRLCPCGYGQIAARVRPRQAGDDFARQFRRHIPVIVPLWFVPLIAGIVTLVHGVAWMPMLLLALFAVNSFVILPLLSRKFGCRHCPQKQTCPWMGNCKG